MTLDEELELRRAKENLKNYINSGYSPEVLERIAVTKYLKPVVDTWRNHCTKIEQERDELKLALVRHKEDCWATNEALYEAKRLREDALSALHAVLNETPLANGEYVHHLSCNGDRRKPAGTRGVSCSCKVGYSRNAQLEKENAKLRIVAQSAAVFFSSINDSVITQKSIDLLRESARKVLGLR